MVRVEDWEYDPDAHPIPEPYDEFYSTFPGQQPDKIPGQLALACTCTCADCRGDEPRHCGYQVCTIEPLGSGADPYGRPDPQTHPEFWTE
jgi:hypothetical protein